MTDMAVCDVCDAGYVITGTPLKLNIEGTTAHSWHIPSGAHICPDCIKIYAPKLGRLGKILMAYIKSKEERGDRSQFYEGISSDDFSE